MMTPKNTEMNEEIKTQRLINEKIKNTEINEEIRD